MTEDERKNRNPAPEVMELDRSKLTELRISDLVRHKVYILVGNRRAATLNYMGTIIDPGTGELAYRFFAPRVALDVFLQEAPGEEHAGKLADGSGNLITLYEYAGPEA